MQEEEDIERQGVRGARGVDLGVDWLELVEAEDAGGPSRSHAAPLRVLLSTGVHYEHVQGCQQRRKATTIK